MLTVTHYQDELNSISTSHFQKASLQEDLATVELCPVDLLLFRNEGFFLKATFGLIVVQLYQDLFLPFRLYAQSHYRIQHLGLLVRQI